MSSGSKSSKSGGIGSGGFGSKRFGSRRPRAGAPGGPPQEPDPAGVAGVRDLARRRALGALHMVVGLGVDRAVHHAGAMADMLHDVDLAADGPADRLFGQHPDGRPTAASARDLGARLDETA